MVLCRIYYYKQNILATWCREEYITISWPAPSTCNHRSSGSTRLCKRPWQEECRRRPCSSCCCPTPRRCSQRRRLAARAFSFVCHASLTLVVSFSVARRFDASIPSWRTFNRHRFGAWAGRDGLRQPLRGPLPLAAGGFHL